MTPQNRGFPVPPVENPCPPDAATFQLALPGKWENIKPVSLQESIGRRKSLRRYKDAPITMDELSFLLWATQGVRSRVINGHAFRTVPSAGCRHCMETYLAVFHVAGIEKGIYRYLPLSHRIVFLKAVEDLESAVIQATYGQGFAGQGAVTFIWTAVASRMEWRYGPASYKLIALDAGHVCQNLYLACEAIDSGTCAIAAYDQEKADELAGVNGQDEFVIYIAPVGKAPGRK